MIGNCAMMVAINRMQIGMKTFRDIEKQSTTSLKSEAETDSKTGTK